MRKVLFLTLTALATVVALAGVAVAQTFPPGQGPDDVYVGGTVVTQVQVAPLAFTGSSNSTPSLILIGLVAVAVGLVLLVATRRRHSVLDRA